MMKIFTSSLAVVGALLALIFSSMTAYRVMIAIGTMLSPNSEIVLPRLHELGEFGLLLLPVAMALTTFFRRPRSAVSALLFLIAAICFGLAALSIGYGSLVLNTAFRNLATAESMEPAMLLGDVAPAKFPLLLGWGLVTVAALTIGAANGIGIADAGTPARSGSRRFGLTLALLSFVFVLLTAMWSVRSYEFLQLHLTDELIRPARIAGAVNGLIRSALLKSIAVGAMAAWSCLMAFSGLGFFHGGRPDAEDASSGESSQPDSLGPLGQET